MARFVGAALCTPIPRPFIMDPAARKAYMGEEVTTMYEAIERMYAERIKSLDVDTFIVVDTHWFSTIDYILNANKRLAGSASDARRRSARRRAAVFRSEVGESDATPGSSFHKERISPKGGAPQSTKLTRPDWSLCGPSETQQQPMTFARDQ